MIADEQLLECPGETSEGFVIAEVAVYELNVAQRKIMKCTQCGGNQLVDGIKVVDRGEGNSRGEVKLEVDLYPKAFLFKNTISAPLSAAICRDCGSVMLSIDRTAASDICDATGIIKRHGDLGSHPRFDDFLKEEPNRKYLVPKDQVRNFSKWLRKNALSD